MPQSVVLQVVVVVQVPDVVAVPSVVVALVPLAVVTEGSEHTVSVVTLVPVLSGAVVSTPGSVASVVCAYNTPVLKNVINRRYFKRYLGNLIIGASERSVLALRKVVLNALVNYVSFERNPRVRPTPGRETQLIPGKVKVDWKRNNSLTLNRAARNPESLNSDEISLTKRSVNLRHNCRFHFGNGGHYGPQPNPNFTAIRRGEDRVSGSAKGKGNSEFHHGRGDTEKINVKPLP